MSKIDLKKELKHLYQPSAKTIALVEVPEMNFLMCDGRGDPNTAPVFQDAVEALYGLSYTLKFALKKEGVGPDFTVMPLEGLWWTEGHGGFDVDDRDNWLWTLMILQPNHISQDHIATATATLKEKKNPRGLENVRFGSFHEGLAFQTLYVGPYSDEGPIIETLHRFAAAEGYELHNKHHEIYLGDPRRVAPERLRTIIRQPVRKK